MFGFKENDSITGCFLPFAHPHLGVVKRPVFFHGFSLANLFNQTKKKEKMVEQLNELYSTWETGLTGEGSASKPKAKM